MNWRSFLAGFLIGLIGVPLVTGIGYLFRAESLFSNLALLAGLASSALAGNLIAKEEHETINIFRGKGAAHGVLGMAAVFPFLVIVTVLAWYS
jgi:hypothetical protein